jgi:hypothetical protein
MVAFGIGIIGGGLIAFEKKSVEMNRISKE